MVQITITFPIYVDADLIEDQVETPNNYSAKLKIAKSSSRTGRHKKVGSAASKELLEETPALFNITKSKYECKSAEKMLIQINEVEKKQMAGLAKREIKLEVEQVKYIGQRVWLNEGDGKLDSLVNWNEGEHHASLGIGHSIWYPLNYTGPSFEESFPNFLVTFKSVYMVTDFYEKWILSAMDHELPEACDNPKSNSIPSSQLLEYTSVAALLFVESPS